MTQKIHDFLDHRLYIATPLDHTYYLKTLKNINQPAFRLFLNQLIHFSYIFKYKHLTTYQFDPRMRTRFSNSSVGRATDC